MINVPTTLVLGAGASMGFEYPSGPQLVRFVDEQLRSTHCQDVLERAGHSRAAMSKLSQALVYCGQTSIDALLEHRPDLLAVGKAAIAYAIMKFENKSIRRLFGAHEDNWYMYLLSRLGPLEQWRHCKLSIVTYNYDRSLEHFLFTAAKETFGLHDDETARAVRRLRIIHVHGRLDLLPHEVDGDGSRPYGEMPTGGAAITSAADRIKIIHEKQDEAQFLNETRNLLCNSPRICFLGFGYHDVNMKRLRFGEIPGNCTMYGTTYGLEIGEKAHIQRMLQANQQSHVVFGEKDVGCLQFLRHSGILLA